MTGTRPAGHGARLSRLVRDLVDAGVMDAGAALAGRVTVDDLSRSNAVGRVAVDGAPVVVVKGGAGSADGVDPVVAERAAYRWLGRLPATAAVAPSAQAVGEDGVATEALDAAITLHVALAGAGPDAQEALVARLGAALGAVHAAPGGARHLVARRPWVLGVAGGRVPAPYAAGEVRARPAVVAALAGLDRAWRPRTVVHGDVKFDNVLVAGGRLVLVDWELAGRGEPAWDLAGVVDGLLLPRLAAGARVDWAAAEALAAPALAAHRAVAPGVHPDRGLLRMAVVARLAQTSLQIAAMAAPRPDELAGTVLAAATALAEDHAGARVGVAA